MKSAIAAMTGVALAMVLGSVVAPEHDTGVYAAGAAKSKSKGKKSKGLGVGDVTPADLLDWTTEFRRWGKWDDSGLGAANFITPKKRRRAADLVELGLSVSMAHDVDQGPPWKGSPSFRSTPLGTTC
jgi:hypothetical protein